MARGNWATLVVVVAKNFAEWRGLMGGKKKSLLIPNRYPWWRRIVLCDLFSKQLSTEFFPRAARKIALLVFVPFVRLRCSTIPNWWFGDVFESPPLSLHPPDVWRRRCWCWQRFLTRRPNPFFPHLRRRAIPSKIRFWNGGRPLIGWPECASIVPVTQQKD